MDVRTEKKAFILNTTQQTNISHHQHYFSRFNENMLKIFVMALQLAFTSAATATAAACTLSHELVAFRHLTM